MKIRFYIGVSSISGGIKQIYRQVDVLNHLGFDAAVCIPKGDCRPSWFDNSNTRVVLASEEEMTKRDFLVMGEQANRLPEIHGAKDASLVVYAQNPYGVIKGFSRGLLGILAMYGRDVKAVMCVSEHSRRVLSWMLKSDVYRIRYSFDRESFVSRDKKKIICCMPRKEGESLRLALSILRAKGHVREYDWKVSEIAGMANSNVAKVMGESSIFLSGSSMEGFGMPVAEAMACGCVVVGFAGVAGHEFMNPDCSFMIEQGDYLTLAVETARIMKLPSEVIKDIGMKASKWITSEYSTEREIASVKEAWEGIMS